MNSGSRGPFQKVIIDEIALEGLEGITISSLWVYLGKYFEIELPLPLAMRQQVWKFLLHIHEHFNFYELPVERETVKLFDRYQYLDPDFSVPLTAATCPFVRYKCVPISDGDIFGSCEYYKERKQIDYNKHLKNSQIDEVFEKFGNKLVIVASQELRYNALTPPNVSRPRELTALQYCIWEAIGRARFNGETTAGTWSLGYFCKDPTIVFYIKNKLIRHGVLAHQLYNEKRIGQRLQVSTLLTLPRFITSHRSNLVKMVEKLFVTLQTKPNYTMPLVDAKSFFPSYENQKTLKKIMISHLFRQIFDTRSVKYVEYFPDSVTKSGHENSKNRHITIVSLRYPHMSLDEMFSKLEVEHDKDEENAKEEFFSEQHSHIDMTIQEEFYRCVLRFGSRGCSQSEICEYMSANHLTLRQIVKNMLAEGLIKSYCLDMGRQRVNMFVAIEHSAVVNKTAKQSLNVMHGLKCSDEPNLPAEDLVQFNDIAQIHARIKPLELDQYATAPSGSETMTQRALRRKAFAVRMIDEKGFLSFLELRKVLRDHEKHQGMTDEVCQKSVKRLLYSMSKQNIVCLYEIFLQHEEQVRLYRYVTHPKIDCEHSVLKREILKLKNSFFLQMEDKRLRRLGSLRAQAQKKTIACKKLAAKQQQEYMKSTEKDLLEMKVLKHPKFLISRYMHEFLFYIVVELNEQQSAMIVDEELFKYWQLNDPSLQIEEFFQSSESGTEKIPHAAYIKDLSWRTFIPPLPRYSDKPARWVYFVDAVERMPLSIFNKIFRFNKGADERLTNYLDHPIRQHYLMRQLPADLQYKISRVQLQKVYVSVLKLLNHMGLVQVGERLNNKDPLLMWVYLNSNATILDTTNSEAGYKQINANRVYPTLSFDLRSFDDLNSYWTNLQRVCIYTKLGFRTNKLPQKSKRSIKYELQFIRDVDFDDAPKHDTGERAGDGLGAAGFSTKLFAHTFRNWSWSVPGSSKAATTTKQLRMTLGGGGVAAGCERIGVSGGGASSLTRRLKTSSAGGASKLRKLATASINIKKASAPTHSSISINSLNAKRLKKTAPRDAIDRDALKNMRTLRVTWTKAEDTLLLMGKATAVYISAPIPVFGNIVMCKIVRDIIRYRLGIHTKTTQACVRRLQFMIKHKRHLPQVPSWLHILQTNEFIQNRYGNGNILAKLRAIYKTQTEVCDAIGIHFMYIMAYLYKLTNKTQDDLNRTRFILPDSTHEFQVKFMEYIPVETDESPVVYRNPENEFDLQASIVLNVLHSSLCAAKDKTPYQLQAFEIFKSYSEDVLNAAFLKARSDSLAVAIKRKNMTLVPKELTGPAYTLSSRYRLKLMFLRMPYGIYNAYYAYYAQVSDKLFAASKTSEQAAECIQLKSPTLGQMMLLAEGSYRQLWQLAVQMPHNMLTVDAEKGGSKVRSLDRLMTHYQSIFEQSPEQEYLKSMDKSAGTSEKQLRVKFHPANSIYKIDYAPYDVISKLPQRQLHFFCALQHMGKDIKINLNKLLKEDTREEAGDGGEHVVERHMIIECPFECIFKHNDYLAEIERIVTEKNSQLSALGEMPPQKLLNLATNNLSMKVDGSNVMTLVRMLESYWHNKETALEQKDLGKISTQKLKSTVLPRDWKQLCQDILTYNDDMDLQNATRDDFDSALNKEERVLRANDVFVINLPVIQLRTGSYSSNANEEDNCCCDMKRSGKIFIPTDIEERKEFVLKKILNDSTYTYAENSFEKLKTKLHDFALSDMQCEQLEEIHNYIQSFKLGVDVMQLKQRFPCEFLIKALDILCTESLIKRMGVASFMYVHKNYVRSWVVRTFHVKRLEREKGINYLKKSIENKNSEEAASSTAEGPTTSAKNQIAKDVIFLKPLPWIRLNGSLNRRVLDRWLGSILNECIVRTGCSVKDISKRFPHLTPVDIMFLLELLSDLGCLYFNEIEKQEIYLFSSYNSLKYNRVPFVFDPYSTYITVRPDAIMRLSLFIGEKKYSAEFV